MNWILFISLLFLTITFTLFVILNEEGERARESINMQIRTELERIGTVTPDYEREIEKLINGTDSISKVQIYNLKGKEYEDVFKYVDFVKPEWEYSRDVWLSKQIFVEIISSGGGDNEWYIKTERISHNTISFIILFLGIAIYWALFSIWALINMYHQRRLNILWFLVIILFNFVGYLFFYLVEQKKNNSLDFSLN